MYGWAWSLTSLMPRRGRLTTIAVLASITVSTSARASALPFAVGSGEARLAASFASRAISYPPRRAAFVVFKSEARLELWADAGSGAWQFVRSYLVRASSGRLGPKLRQGDHQVPEGVYAIDALNPRSNYHLSMRIGYPNAFDRERAREDGRVQLGGDIMIHGGNASDGCLPVGDRAVEELFALTDRIGVENTIAILSPLDLRRVGVAAAYSRASQRPAWLAALYASIADALRDFPLQPEDESIVVAKHPIAKKPRCKPYDAADCVTRCRGGDVASCGRAGLLYEGGRGVAGDSAKAWSFLRKACAEGDALGCGELGELLIADDGMRRDAARGAELAQAACDGGDGHACVHLVQLCSDRTIYPQTREQCTDDYSQRLYERAVKMLHGDCSGWGAFDCYTLGTMYERSDPRTAFRFAASSCRDGDSAGCYSLGELYEDQGDAALARKSFARACEIGDSRGCERTGVAAQSAASER